MSALEWSRNHRLSITFSVAHDCLEINIRSRKTCRDGILHPATDATFPLSGLRPDGNRDCIVHQPGVGLATPGLIADVLLGQTKAKLLFRSQPYLNQT